MVTGTRMATAVLCFVLVGCGPTGVVPFVPLDDDDNMDPAFGERVDLIIEAVGLESFEGLTVWADVLEADSPPMPATVIDGSAHIILPGSFEPESEVFLSVGLHIDFGDDGTCSPEDLYVVGLGTVTEHGNPTLAWMDLNGPETFIEPCL